ncbi:MAG TPA: hypothetical protein VF020_15135 [Chthoniobacterales bacterium]
MLRVHFFSPLSLRCREMIMDFPAAQATAANIAGKPEYLLLAGIFLGLGQQNERDYYWRAEQ